MPLVRCLVLILGNWPEFRVVLQEHLSSSFFLRTESISVFSMSMQTLVSVLGVFSAYTAEGGYSSWWK